MATKIQSTCVGCKAECHKRERPKDTMTKAQRQHYFYWYVVGIFEAKVPLYTKVSTLIEELKAIEAMSDV